MSAESVEGTLVFGPKKLSTIRQELQRAWAAPGENPIRWLEARMTGPERQGSAASEESEVLRSSRCFLELSGRGKGGNQRVGVRT